MLRIALVSTPFVQVPPRGYGGTEAIVGQLAAGLVRRGHEVYVYATGDSPPIGHLRAFYPRAVWPPDVRREMAQAAWAARDLRRLGGVDLVHTHSAALLMLAEHLGAPLVYTLHHGPDPVCEDLYRVVAGDTTFVAISERQRAMLPPLGDVRVVHHGLDASRFPVGVGEGGYAAFVGRFAPEKGLDVAIDAARAAGVPLRVGGRCHPPDVDWHRREVLTRLGPGVTMVGEVEHPAKCALLGGALATLFPIRWEEPFGLVMIESMLCGTPVLACPRGSAPEIVDEGVTGWLVEDAAAMARVLRALASGRLRFDRARCRARAETRFGQARMVDDYLAIYAELVGQPARLREDAEA